MSESTITITPGGPGAIGGPDRTRIAVDQSIPRKYAHPGVLVSTDWVQHNINTPGVRIVEVDVDPKLYAAGHIPGSVGWNWNTQLQDPVRRDIPSKEAWEDLLSQSGVKPSDTLVLYGDASNWFAAFAFWVAKIYGHQDVRLLNGGRVRWLNEESRPLTPELPNISKTTYKVTSTQPELRIFLPEVLTRGADRTLIDVRSPDEFSGKVIAPPGMTETAQRGGHIPGARNVPWASAVKQDGTFKSTEELRELYPIQAQTPTITYCRIGERSSHTWFVLKYLLGVEDVRNYDGSWTEYGSVIGVPIERNA
jgi:thiosulfate/3-mercaptopyruvate sulfurtransferase